MFNIKKFTVQRPIYTVIFLKIKNFKEVNEIDRGFQQRVSQTLNMESHIKRGY